MLLKKYWAHTLVFICWLMTILAFLEKIPVPAMLFLPILSIVHLIAITNQSSTVCYFLPYAIILSPLFGSIKVAGMNMIFSDIMILYTLFVMLVFRHGDLRQSRSFYFLLLLLVMSCIVHFLAGDITTFKPLVSILEIFIVYVIAKQGFKNLNLNLFLNSSCLAVALGVILMFVAFYQGVNLNDYNGDSNVLTSNAEEFNFDNYRMSFFYTNFPFIIASIFFILVYRIVTVTSTFIRFLMLALAMLTCLALIASGNKTTLIATITILVVSTVIFDYKKIFRVRSFIYVAVFLLAVYYIVYNLFLNEQNQDMFTNRMLSSDSLIDRLGVYVNTYYLLVEAPYRLFIGYGPDFLTGAGPYEVAYAFKLNYFTKVEQGAVDSGILTFILDYGLLLFLIIAYPVFKLLMFLAKKINHEKLLFIRLLMVFALSGVTQLIGISKIFWFFVLIFALAKSQLQQTNITDNKTGHTTI